MSARSALVSTLILGLYLHIYVHIQLEHAIYLEAELMNEYLYPQNSHAPLSTWFPVEVYLSHMSLLCQILWTICQWLLIALKVKCKMNP